MEQAEARATGGRRKEREPWPGRGEGLRGASSDERSCVGAAGGDGGDGASWTTMGRSGRERQMRCRSECNTAPRGRAHRTRSSLLGPTTRPEARWLGRQRVRQRPGSSEMLRLAEAISGAVVKLPAAAAAS